MRRTRKSLAVVAFLAFSSTALLMVTLLPRSQRRAISEEDAAHLLQAKWLSGHLPRSLTEGHIEYRHSKVVKNNDKSEDNAVIKVPSPARLPEGIKKDSGRNKSPLLYTRSHSQSRYSGSRAMKFPVTVSRGRESRALTPTVKEDMVCMQTPTSCLQADSLQKEEKKRLKSCLEKAISYIEYQRAYTGKSNISLTECNCRLRDSGQHNKRVALVSLPGSGNTWVRGLLEHATEICTGAMWCDPNLRATHFCGEGLHGARTLVVKNHDPTIRWRGEYLPRKQDVSENNKPEFDGVIFLHRNPYDAMVAEHNREVGYAQWEATLGGNRFRLSHHVQSFGAEYFGDNVKWNHRVTELAKIWETMVTHLLVGNSNMERVLVIKYEDLVKDAPSEVVRMLKFLGYFETSNSLKQRMKMNFTAFKRSHNSTVFEHFTPAQKRLINTVINNVSSRLKSYVLPLKDYIRP